MLCMGDGYALLGIDSTFTTESNALIQLLVQISQFVLKSEMT